ILHRHAAVDRGVFVLAVGGHLAVVPLGAVAAIVFDVQRVTLGPAGSGLRVPGLNRVAALVLAVAIVGLGGLAVVQPVGIAEAVVFEIRPRRLTVVRGKGVRAAVAAYHRQVGVHCRWYLYSSLTFFRGLIANPTII